jgi:hypothetical protein
VMPVASPTMARVSKPRSVTVRDMEDLLPERSGRSRSWDPTPP